MRVKTYRGTSTHAIMEQVKAEMGPEAVILSNRTVHENGAPVCELTVAVEVEPEPSQAPLPRQGTDSRGIPNNETPDSSGDRFASALADSLADSMNDSASFSSKRRTAPKRATASSPSPFGDSDSMNAVAEGARRIAMAYARQNGVESPEVEDCPDPVDLTEEVPSRRNASRQHTQRPNTLQHNTAHRTAGESSNAPWPGQHHGCGSVAPWQEEWGQIKHLLYDLMGERMDVSGLTPRQRQAMDYLEREGVNKKVTLVVHDILRREPDRTVLSALAEVVAAKPFDRTAYPARYQLFTGPHGCGKTSTLIRTALALRKAAPRARICLVSAGDAQAKGRMQLKHYAELSGMSYREVAGRGEFKNLTAEERDFDVIFIDAPGLGGGSVSGGPNSPATDTPTSLGGFLDRYGMAGADLQAHLVLSPYFAPAQLSTFLRTYASPRLASIVWTKLDECCAFGEIINAGEECGLPVSSLSFGPGLSGTLAPAAHMALWRLIFKHELPACTPAVRASKTSGD